MRLGVINISVIHIDMLCNIAVINHRFQKSKIVNSRINTQPFIIGNSETYSNESNNSLKKKQKKKLCQNSYFLSVP